MANPHHADTRPLTLDPTLDEADAMRALRRYRRREAVRLIWRDVNGLDTVEQTLAGSTALAESCLATAHDFGERVLIRRHGVPRSTEGIA
ncbi:hypothetical protein DNR41_27360, partial [Escherichia coli]|uniref:hypothetical protein n=1 Tax=Escherichia coli TaxID=562 RepID=UPI000DBBDD2B